MLHTSVETSLKYNNFYQAQVLYTDHFGWPITACPYASTSSMEFIEVSEVINQIVRRACLFNPDEVKKPTTTAFTTTTTTTTTTATTPNGVEKEKDDVLKELVQAASDLVSLINNFLERS